MGNVVVKHDVLLWAIERSEEPEVLPKKFPKLKEWLSGHSYPTLKQLEKLAKATFTPLGFFFLDQPPEEQLLIPYFRTIPSNEPWKPNPNIIETIQIMEQRQLWMREFLIEQSNERIPFVKSLQQNEEPRIVAEQMRKILDLEINWAFGEHTYESALRRFRETLEQVGILVFINGIVGNNTRRALKLEEFRGFVLVDDYAPLVFVNGADSKSAQMFTLAHEFAHILLGSSAAFDLREMKPADDPIEKACNNIAAEFLVPTDEFNRAWNTGKKDIDRFQRLAKQFKVSPIVIALRALELDYIDNKGFQKFYDDYKQKGYDRPRKRVKTGGDFYKNQNLRVGKRFALAIAQATQEGKLLYSEAYCLTGLYGRTFTRYINSLFEVGVGHNV